MEEEEVVLEEESEARPKEAPSTQSAPNPEAESTKAPLHTPADIVKSLNHTIIKDLNKHIISHIDGFSKLLFQATHSLAHFPPVLIDTFQNINTGDVQEKLLDFALVLLFSAFFGYVAEGILRLILNRFKGPLQTPITLARFTFHLGLTFIPLLGFGVTAAFVAHFLDKSHVLPYVIAVIGVLFMTRLILKYFKLLLQPAKVELRVIPLTDRNARRFYRMIGLLTQVLLWGTLLGQGFLILGMSPENYQIWQNIVAFAVLMVVAALVIDYRSVVEEWFHQDELQFENVPRVLVGLINVFARIWYILALGVMFVLYMAWVYDEVDRVINLLRETGLSIFLLVAFRTLSHSLRRVSERMKRSFQEEGSTGSAFPMTQSTFFLVPLGHILLYVTTFLLALEIWGLNFLVLLNNPTIQKNLLRALSIVLVVVVVKVLWGLIDLLAKSNLQSFQKGRQKIEPSLFAKTITPILRSTSKGMLAVLGFLVVLSELSVDIMPIVYAFSVISLAISFGAQTMVKDLITGFLYLFEGNIAVGEVVKIGEHKGKVEAITLRSVFLRHGDGSIQSIPFSEVSYITNLSRDYTDHAVAAFVGHATPIQAIYDVLNQTFDQIKQHPTWGKEIKSDLKISGVESFADLALKVSASIVTTPDPKGYFLREFNAILQDNMLKAGIMPPTQFQVQPPLPPSYPAFSTSS